MFRISNQPIELLRPGHTVEFVGDWPETKKNRSFEVVAAQQVPYIVDRVYPTADYNDLDFSDESNFGLIPDDAKTLYQILLGLKGGNGWIVYPMLPVGHYLNRLEESALVPTPGSATLRHLGGFTSEQSPFDDPRVEFHTVKDVHAMTLRAYNNSGKFTKMIFNFLVNRCHIVPLADAGAEGPVGRRPEPRDERRGVKKLIHHDEWKW